MDSAGAVSRAVDVMGAWIDGGDDIDALTNRLDECLVDPAIFRNVLCGLVSLCGSMLFDLEELTRAPMTEILRDHALRL